MSPTSLNTTSGHSGVGANDTLSYLREYEHLTLARLLLAQDDGAAKLLDRLLTEATNGGRSSSIIEISLLQAVAGLKAADAGGPLAPLQRALALAEPEGYVRVFVEHGDRMESLLKAALKRGIAPVYTRKLLSAFGPAPQKAQLHPDLIEPLSDRELDVLRLLRSDLGGPEIACEISLNTMRTHTKSIYEKLGVNTRRSAVHRAEELRLLTRSAP